MSHSNSDAEISPLEIASPSSEPDSGSESSRSSTSSSSSGGDKDHGQNEEMIDFVQKKATHGFGILIQNFCIHYHYHLAFF